MVSYCTWALAAAVAIMYIWTAEAQQSPSNTEVSVGNTPVDTPKLDSTAGEATKPPPKNGRPPRRPRRPRRNRRRRLRQRNGKNGQQINDQNNGASATGSVGSENKKSSLAGTADNPSSQTNTQTKEIVPAKAQAVKQQPKTKKSSPTQDDFFGAFFEAEAVTGVPDPTGPPPDFDPNKPPGKKVVPVVDKSKGIAHDGTPCNETYKEHDTIPTKYMVKYAEGTWETLECPPTRGASKLVWRQDLCSCGQELIAQDPNDWCAQMGYLPDPDNRHSYIRRHHVSHDLMHCPATLVWSQDKCLCVFDPAVQDRPIEQKVRFVCKKILELKFEQELRNSVEGYHVEPVNLRRRGRLPRIRYRKVPGSTDKAAMIVSQPLEFLAFRGNDFQLQVTYAISFKLSPRHKTRQNFMVLFTDECIGNQGGKNKPRKPSIALLFQPSTNTYNLQFRTEQTEIDQNISGATPDSYGWFKTVVYFEDKTVNLENNGKKLFTQTDVSGKIPQNKCPLYIAGRGQGFDRSQDFYGYLDNVNLVKDCKFHEANIKFL